MLKDISIIVPIYNDSDVIESTVDSLLSFFVKENLNGEIIVVNDGGEESGVKPVLEKQIKNPLLIKIIDRKINMGKGFSLREGIKESSGAVVFYMDADLPYGLEPLKQMYDKISYNKFDLVFANRNLSGKDGMKQAPTLRKIAHFFYSLIVGPLVYNCSDPAAGLKAMTRKVAKEVIPYLTIDRFAFDIEFVFLVNKIGLRIFQIPVTLQQSGKSKNLNIITDSPQMIKDVLKIAWRNKTGFYKKYEKNII